MAFETGSATSVADLILKISTFLTSHGWTEDERNNTDGDFAFSKNSVFVSGRWDTTSPSIVALYQATAFDGAATLPGDHTGDSGNGYNDTSSHTNANLDNERHFDLESDGSFPTYWFFENDSGPAYFHAVVEFATNKFVHFGWGEINKSGDWTGGEYVYGNYHVGTAGSLTTNSTFLLDGVFSTSSGVNNRRAATIRMSGVTDQPVGSSWGQVWGRDTNIPDDSASSDKAIVSGGFRSGGFATYLGLFAGSVTTGLIPGYPIHLFTLSNFITSGTKARHLGSMADVRGINIRNFSPAQQVEIGGDTWYVFPARFRDLTSVEGATGYSGIMYKRVDA